MMCEVREETLIDFLSGELSEGNALGLEQHLAECKECRATVRELARVSHPFLSEAPWEPDAAMADRILRRARSEGCAPAASSRTVAPTARPLRRAAVWSWLARPLPSYAAAGIAGLALAVGLLLGNGGGREAGRAVPDEKAGSRQSSAPAGRSADRGPGLPAGSLPRDGTPQEPTVSERRTRGPAGGRHATRTLAFVAVYSDATGLTTPGTSDSL